LGFFAGRRAVELDPVIAGRVVLVEYANVPKNIGTVVSSRLATLHELQTSLGVRDLYDLLEILAVDICNDRRIKQAPRRV
jgi:hypothetical protein